MKHTESVARPGCMLRPWVPSCLVSLVWLHPCDKGMDGWEGEHVQEMPPCAALSWLWHTCFFGFARFLYVFARLHISNVKTPPRGAALGSLCVKQCLLGACQPQHGRNIAWLALHTVPPAQQEAWQGCGTAGSGLPVARCK